MPIGVLCSRSGTCYAAANDIACTFMHAAVVVLTRCFPVRPRSVPSECPQGVEDLWRRCTLQNPGARPSASDVLDVLVAMAELRRAP